MAKIQQPTRRDIVLTKCSNLTVGKIGFPEINQPQKDQNCTENVHHFESTADARV